MDELRWIHISVILTALLHFTVSGNRHFFTIKQGEDVTLPCENVINHQQRCGGTTWLFIDSTNTRTVELIERGWVNKNAGAKSDRLSVTEDCSLVMTKVTQEDVGHYFCRQEKLGSQGDTLSYLSVVNITEHTDHSYLSVTCDVRTPGGCRHTVKWFNEGSDQDENNQHVQTSQSDSGCCAIARIPKAHASRDILLKCEVTERDTGRVQHFPFSRQTTGEDTKNDPKETTTSATMTPTGPTEHITAAGTNDSSNLHTRFIVVSVGLSALIITVVTVNI
ncbi:uncharacterized protein LOC121521637 isoform X2 [Cheilinus undulatus]|uniref:uncharacterized protein LOC121521637 isoform X2 n=1 Tax=Cheilinus undulatus TaxID=241271 RepID=UPI001BD6827E|nr:uncharacterized protein LOC121521637 isoform X2 [Cheilinus undulatus]